MRPIRNRRIDLSTPLVTIVVPMYNVAEYLSTTLASIVDQSYGNLEILLVNDGSQDDTAAIARQWARFDRRIRVISQENRGLGGARNTGIANATGKYITFADSDDSLYKNSIETMVRSLESSKSDMAIGAMVRRNAGKIWMPHWVRRVHASDRIGVNLADAPDILPDVFACNKLYRRDFFDEVIGEFPTGILYEDQEPSLAAYLGADKFDILAEPVYIWEIRADGSSLSQQKARMRDLTDRLGVVKRMAAMIKEDTPSHVRDAFYSKAFELDLWQYIEQVPRVDREYFVTLCDGISELVSMSGGGFWSQIPTYHRLLTHYAAEHDYDSIMTVLAGRQEEGFGGHLELSGEGWLCEKPTYLRNLKVVPEDRFFRIDPSSLDVNGSVSGVKWVSDHVVEITCRATVLSDFDSGASQVAAFSLVNDATGQVVPLQSERFTDPFMVESVRAAAVDASTTGYILHIDTSDLRCDPGEQWQLTAHVTIGEYVVSGPLLGIQDDRGAAVLGFAEWDGHKKVVIAHSQYAGLVLRRAEPQCVADDVKLDGRNLSFVAKVLNGKRIAVVEVRNPRTGQVAVAQPSGFNRFGDAEFNIMIPLPPERWRVPSNQRWDVKVRFTDRRSARLLMTESRFSFDARSSGIASLILDCNSYGYLRLSELPCRIECDSISIDTNLGTLTFSGRAQLSHGSVAGNMVLSNDAGEVHASSTEWDSEQRRFTAVFSLSVDDWYKRNVSVRHGSYSLRCSISAPCDPSKAHVQWVTIRDQDVSELPWRGQASQTRVTVTRTRNAKSVWVAMQNPFEVEELGVYNRVRMKRASLERSARTGLEDSVVFETYHGKRVSDSPLSLFNRLQDEHPHLKLYWSVSSTEVSVPPGATRVVQMTNEWFDVVHRAKYLVNNSNFPGPFRKQPGQKYLQTWHGTPMKKIAEDMPPGNLSMGYRLTMRREAKFWDLLMAQNDFAAEVLPRAFWYSGDTLNVGYPRNDILRHPDSRERSAFVRERLGIRAGAKVVLYAPTFRDTKKKAGAYELDTELDFDLLSARLPADTTVLLRGHSNTLGGRTQDLPDTVIDVTDYGEISELFLATDVLVTDYSSMMFDFVVTEKPMLFFVPDLEEYESSTRGFYLRFTDICPGPMYSSTIELAEGIVQALEEPQRFRTESYMSFASRFAPRDDGGATERLVEELADRGWFV